MGAAGSTSSLDDIVDNRVESAPCSSDAAMRRHDRYKSVHRWDGARDGGLDIRGHVREVGAEECLSRDRERQASHLARNIDSDSVSPPFLPSSGVAHDKWGVRLDSLAIERRLHDATSRHMQRPVRREKAVAQESLGTIESVAFHEPVGTGQEHVFDRRGMVEEKREARAQLKSDDVIRALCQLLQESEWVSLPSTQRPERARWIRW